MFSKPASTWAQESSSSFWSSPQLWVAKNHQKSRQQTNTLRMHQKSQGQRTGAWDPALAQAAPADTNPTCWADAYRITWSGCDTKHGNIFFCLQCNISLLQLFSCSKSLFQQMLFSTLAAVTYPSLSGCLDRRLRVCPSHLTCFLQKNGWTDDSPLQQHWGTHLDNWASK